MNLLRTYDTKLGSIVALLPKTLDRPLRLLGKATIPTVWASILAMTALVDAQDRTTVLVVMLFVPLASLSKFIFRRQRPPTIFAGNMRIKSYSFPSSHAYAAALAGSFLIVQLVAAGFPLLAVVIGLLILIIGVSRVYIGAHYPSDVTAGWLLGLLITTAIVLTR